MNTNLRTARTLDKDEGKGAEDYQERRRDEQEGDWGLAAIVCALAGQRFSRR